MDPRGKGVNDGGGNKLGASNRDEIETFQLLRGADPIIAENWVQKMEKILMVLDCIEKQKVLFATFKLVGEVGRWWLAVKLLEEQEVVSIMMTWKEVFYDQYFPASTKNAKAEEFFNLTQGNLIMQQYAARFVELSCFSPFMILDEYQKVRWFERGLKQRIHEHVDVYRYRAFHN
ncbi:uncharacterized protein LOC131143854 [Malania oleifera]|uniref:uncharacterized protein LOC131143854 n=1 Tax=Malania oleifera TaxID=397392 RepID=UPI0025AE8300|nr:uncharacterized protein LOC131143854 [Malania oleifera]